MIKISVIGDKKKSFRILIKSSDWRELVKPRAIYPTFLKHIHYSLGFTLFGGGNHSLWLVHHIVIIFYIAYFPTV